MLRQLHTCYPAAIKSSHTWTVIKENSTKAIPIVLTISWTKKLQFPNKTRPFVHPLSHSDHNISWCQGKRSNLQLTVCKLNVCTCSLVPCSTGGKKKPKNKKTCNKFANIFFCFLLCFSFNCFRWLCKLGLQRWGRKTNMSETRRKVQKKSGTLRKRRTTKQKDKFATIVFLELCFACKCLQLIMQIRFATTRKKKNISEALRKTQKKSGTLRKKRTTKQKDKFANTVFLALLCFAFKCSRWLCKSDLQRWGRGKKNQRNPNEKYRKKSGTLRKKEKNHKTKHCIITYMIWQAGNYWQLSQEAQQHHHNWCRKQAIHSASCPLSSQTQVPLPPDPPSLLLSVQIILHLQKIYNNNTCFWPIASWNRYRGAKFLPKLATISRTLLIPSYDTHLQSRFFFNC